jgi:proteasome lid subunit RPN8/RPN11
MARLMITSRHLQTVTQHAAASYPEECCGFLIGRSDAGTTVVERVLSVGNERQESRHNRYLISPETVLAANKEVRALSLDVVGYYHSHPDHPARPSEFDRDHAWPGLSYVIVSVEGGRVADTRSWRLADDRERFEEEAIEPAAGPAAPLAPVGVQKEAV